MILTKYNIRLEGQVRFVPINEIQPGTELKQTVFGGNGEILLNSGVVLDNYYLNKLKKLGLNGVYIEDAISEGIEVKDIIGDELRQKSIKHIKQTFLTVQKPHVSEQEKEHQFDELNQTVKNVVDEVLSNNDLMINMIDLKVFNEYTFYHSLNVALIAIVLGVSLGLSKQDLNELCLASFLHDIGKLFVPDTILNKSGPLSEKEMSVIKKHPQDGRDYLHKHHQISNKTAEGIYSHHEKWNGTGYPEQLKHSDIPFFGRIISVADVYDALVSDRPYRCGYEPSDALEYILSGNDLFFDPSVVDALMSKVSPYPLGSIVFLSNNTTGIVVKNFEKRGSRPLVRVFEENGKIVSPYILDLCSSSNLSVTITGTKKQTSAQ